MREWVIYAVIMSAIFAIFFRGGNVAGAIAGVLISGPLYLGFGAVMAKFGYQRQRLKDVRAAKGDAADAATSAPVPSASRSKPAPTSRTSSRPTSTTKRKR